MALANVSPIAASAKANEWPSSPAVKSAFTLPRDKTSSFTGKLNFAENCLDVSTGMPCLRAGIADPDHILVPANSWACRSRPNRRIKQPSFLLRPSRAIPRKRLSSSLTATTVLLRARSNEARQTAAWIQGGAHQACRPYRWHQLLVVQPPPVPGAGGFSLGLEDRAGLGKDALAKATNALVTAATPRWARGSRGRARSAPILRLMRTNDPR
jgi:hypothetical protein